MYNCIIAFFYVEITKPKRHEPTAGQQNSENQRIQIG
jgi:hypothetical protein